MRLFSGELRLAACAKVTINGDQILASTKVECGTGEANDHRVREVEKEDERR